MPSNRNKYSHLIIEKPKNDLPIHVIESIINLCDQKTKAKFSITNKYYNEFIGDIQPNYLRNQIYFINLMKKLCSLTDFNFFNLRILSKKYHIIISDENKYTIYMYIIDRQNRKNTITRSYSKSLATNAFINLLNGTKIVKEANQKAKILFINIFDHISEICLTTHLSEEINEWIKYLDFKT